MDILHSIRYNEASPEPELRELKPSMRQYKSLQDLFLQRWKQPRELAPPISRIFEIRYNESDMLGYEQYRTRFGAYTEALEFHGTDRACMLGEHSNPRCRKTLCGLKTCYLCSVIRHSFKVSACGRKNLFKRFGHGIYTSPVSSKAHGYVRNTQIFGLAPYKAMLIVRVVRGRSWVTQGNARDLISPPPGYDSVYGVPGDSLRYSETVLYDNDAIRPAYLVLYDDLQDYQEHEYE